MIFAAVLGRPHLGAEDEREPALQFDPCLCQGRTRTSRGLSLPPPAQAFERRACPMLITAWRNMGRGVAKIFRTKPAPASPQAGPSVNATPARSGRSLPEPRCPAPGSRARPVGALGFPVAHLGQVRRQQVAEKLPVAVEVVQHASSQGRPPGRPRCWRPRRGWTRRARASSLPRAHSGVRLVGEHQLGAFSPGRFHAFDADVGGHGVAAVTARSEAYGTCCARIHERGVDLVGEHPAAVALDHLGDRDQLAGSNTRPIGLYGLHRTSRSPPARYAASTPSRSN